MTRRRRDCPSGAVADPTRRRSTGPRRVRDPLLWVIAPLAAALYAPSLANDLVLDAPTLVRENPLIQSLANLPILFQSDYWEPITRGGLYRPLATTSLALTWAVAGDSPLAHHAVNLALHAANAALVALLFLSLCGDRLAAAAGAALFAAHAVNSEAVANVAGRADLLCAGFFLAALLAHVRAESATPKRRRRLRGASVAAFALALLSKETALTLPGVVLLHDLVFARLGEERPLRRLALLLRTRLAGPYAGYVAVTLAYFGVRYWALGIANPAPTTSRLDNPLLFLDTPWRVLSALEIALRYLGLLVFPRQLVYDRSYAQLQPIESLADPALLTILAVGAAAVGLVIWSWRHARDLCFAIGFAGVTFSIVSNVAVGIGTVMAERLLYLPSVGFSLAAAIGLRRALARRLEPEAARRAFLAAAAVAIALHAGRTLARAHDWSSEERLFLHDLALSPRSARVQGNAGAVLVQAGRFEEARAHFERALAIWPELHSARSGLATALLALKRREEAEAQLETLVASGAADEDALNNLGFVLVDKGRDVDRGLRLILRAVQRKPENPNYLDSLGWAYFRAGRPEEAYHWLRRSLGLEDAETPRRHLAEVERALAARERRGGPAGTATPP